MEKQKINILLADDDVDDCAFFRDALDDLSLSYTLKTVIDGVELMKYLSKLNDDNLPDIIFLDLNMPRKSGFECLSEIKSLDNLKHLPIIIYSTSFNPTIVDLLYEKGAIYFIQKPGDFSKLRNVLFEAITLATIEKNLQPSRDKFILHS